MRKEKQQPEKIGRFQKELERSVSRKIALLVLIGGFFFCAAILGISEISRQYNKEKYLNIIARTVQEVDVSVKGFLEEQDNQEIFIGCMKEKDHGNEVGYLLSKYNVDAPVDIQVILSDSSGNVIYSSYSKDSMNLHRIEFNRIVGVNARRQENQIYHTVYYFSGETSDYVFVKPLFEEESYLGSVAVYVNGEEWRPLLSQYQYDTIITNQNNDIIYCSNHSFLPERSANKYRPSDRGPYLWVNENRYRVDARILKDSGIALYSFIYSPRNVLYVLIGLGTIMALGAVWTLLFRNMSRSMAKKTAESVNLLVDEIRIIRKEDTDHVIHINTGDEFEEIAEQINKMVRSINELNGKNVELATINSRMEIENLQAQLNPHFIYNTLDNIKYLIAADPLKAAEMIERFTHILRYSINNCKETVTLEEDMRYIKDYLLIQEMRFSDRFVYEIDIAEECLHYQIPKLLLQPLVENSIKYGFKKKMSIRVEMKGWCEQGYLFLSVRDDGAGVPKATLETLRQIIQCEADTPHNGLQSINRRLLLKYGKESGMRLDSIEGENFQVTLKLWIC